MRLRYRIPLILLVVIAAYGFLSYTILRGLVFNSYLSLEKNEAQKDILRCVESLQREIHHLDTVAHDWAAWNDMYSFVQEPNETFISSNLVPETFTDNQLDLICIYNQRKEIVWGQMWDRDAGKKIDPTEFFPVAGPKVHVFFEIREPEDAVAGVFMSARGPILTACRSITTSDHQGTARGYFIMGKFLNEAVINLLREQTRVAHEIISISSLPPSDLDSRILEHITPEQPIYCTTHSHDILNAFTMFPDVSGRPALLFKATLSRDIRRKGASTLRLACLSICGSGLMVIGVLVMLLRRSVILPLTNLTHLVTTINSTNESALPVIREPKDEIGMLYQEFTDMIKRIQNAHLQLKAINKKLSSEITDRKKIEEDLLRHQAQLREMSVALQFTEERERRLIAADLHDRIGQNLALVQIKLDALSQNRASDGQCQTLSELSRFMEEIIHDTRSLMFNISPPVLYEMGLEAAVEWLSDDLFSKFGIPISIYCNQNTIPMKNSVRVAAYRAIRELLNNAMKHSKATEVSVNIHQEDSLLQVEISDNGKGFDLFKNKPFIIMKTGFGLFSIRENLKAMGGSVKIRSQNGQGTQVTLTVPLQKDGPHTVGKHDGNKDYTG